MNEMMIDKLKYDSPSAQIVVFPEQDIVTTSGGGNGSIILPEDEW